MIDGRLWQRQCLYKFIKTIARFDGSCLKTGGRPNSRKGITKKVLASGGSDTKGSLQPKFEDAGIQVWSGTLGACKICSFIA